VAPALYFLVPLALPFDIVPQGLKETVLPRLGDKRGRGFVKLAFTELADAMDRAAEKFDSGEQPGPVRRSAED
jgi:hypothetical protein